jgi:hypothetical protein
MSLARAINRAVRPALGEWSHPLYVRTGTSPWSMENSPLPNIALD